MSFAERPASSMTSRSTNVIKRNGFTSSLASLASRGLRKSGNQLLQVAKLISPKPELTHDAQQVLDANKVFRNKHAGKRGFVIGTGPSLHTQDLSPLAGEITLTLSAFWKHPEVEKWQPTYYCFSDPLLFDGSPTMSEFFRSMLERVPRTTFFAPLAARETVEREKLLPREQTHYVAFDGDLSEMNVDDIDLQTFVPGVMNVAQMCIMVAICMGLSPIYLLGLDHDWLAHQGETKHFYRGHAGLDKHPEVKPVLADWSYRHLMECQIVGWKAYENLLDLARKKNIQILNATNGGFLDVYERVDYNELIAE